MLSFCNPSSLQMQEKATWLRFYFNYLDDEQGGNQKQELFKKIYLYKIILFRCPYENNILWYYHFFVFSRKEQYVTRNVLITVNCAHSNKLSRRRLLFSVKILRNIIIIIIKTVFITIYIFIYINVTRPIGDDLVCMMRGEK